MGSDNRPPYYALYYIIFQSTLPAGGATHHSISRFIYNDFNPRSPQGERHVGGNMTFAQLGISIHAPRRGSDKDGHWEGYFTEISIHAPRRGSDPGSPEGRGEKVISIHAPRRGSDI